MPVAIAKILFIECITDHAVNIAWQIINTGVGPQLFHIHASGGGAEGQEFLY